MSPRPSRARARVVISSLARDRFVQAFLAATFAEALLIWAVMAGTAPRLQVTPEVEVWLRLPFHVVRILAVFSGLGAIRDRRERVFWGYLGIAFSLWTLARVVGLVEAAGLLDVELWVAFLILLGDLLLLLAIERTPHEVHRTGGLDLDQRLKSIAVASVVSGFFIYFVLVPHWLAPEEQTSGLAYFTYLAIDALLIARFLSVGLRCREPRWRGIYAGLFAAVAVNGTFDAVDVLAQELASPWRTSAVLPFLPVVSLFGYVVAVRFRHVAVPVAGSEPAPTPSDPLNPMRTGSLLLASSLLFPLVHLAVYGDLRPGDPMLRAHALTALVSMSVLGIAAVIAYRVLERQYAQQEEAGRLADTRVQLAHRMEEIGQMSGGVAHDFNNLLMAISGFADMARAELPPGHPSRALVDQVIRLAARATDLTRQLLAFSRRQSVQIVEVDVNALVSHVARSLGGWMGEDVSVTTDLAGDAALRVRANTGRLESVLLNLAASARDSMPRGGQLFIRTREVELDAPTLAGLSLRPGRHIELTVRDTGERVPASMLPHLFEPFVAPAGRARGAGLNLAAAYGLVVQSGGAIWASIPQEGGVEYTIVLPAVGSES